MANESTSRAQQNIADRLTRAGYQDVKIGYRFEGGNPILNHAASRHIYARIGQEDFILVLNGNSMDTLVGNTELKTLADKVTALSSTGYFPVVMFLDGEKSPFRRVVSDYPFVDLRAGERVVKLRDLERSASASLGEVAYFVEDTGAIEVCRHSAFVPDYTRVDPASIRDLEARDRLKIAIRRQERDGSKPLIKERKQIVTETLNAGEPIKLVGVPRYGNPNFGSFVRKKDSGVYTRCSELLFEEEAANGDQEAVGQAMTKTARFLRDLDRDQIAYLSLRFGNKFGSYTR